MNGEPPLGRLEHRDQRARLERHAGMAGENELALDERRAGRRRLADAYRMLERQIAESRAALG